MAGNVAVRFSVQNYETVKVALEGLGKDGQKALNALEASAKKPAGGLMSLSSIIENLKDRVIGLGVSIGPAGTALIQLGPAGIAVAAALGLVAKAMTFLNENATEFALKGKQIKDAAQNIGISINQFALLRSAGQRVGMDAEQTATFLEKLTISVDELKRGSGPLFDALMRIDQGLARELATATSTAEAIDILVRAYARLDDQGRRNTLTKAIAGRGAVGVGQLLDYLAEMYGLAGIERAAQAAGKEIDEGLLKRIVKLKDEIDETNRKTAIAWGRLFGEAILQQQKRSAEYWLTIAEAAERIARSTSGMQTSGTGPTALPGTAFGPLRLLERFGIMVGPDSASTGKSGNPDSAGLSFGRGLIGRQRSGDPLRPGVRRLRLSSLKRNAGLDFQCLRRGDYASRADAPKDPRTERRPRRQQAVYPTPLQPVLLALSLCAGSRRRRRAHAARHRVGRAASSPTSEGPAGPTGQGLHQECRGNGGGRALGAQGGARDLRSAASPRFEHPGSDPPVDRRAEAQREPGRRPGGRTARHDIDFDRDGQGHQVCQRVVH